MSDTWPRSLVLAGAGKMGGALLGGWLAKGLAPAAVRIVDPYLNAAATHDWQQKEVTVETIFSTPPPPEAKPNVLVLAMKPQTFAEAPDQYALLAGPETLVISILAGKTLAALRAGLPAAGTIVRTMPNLPAAIGHGATGAAAEPSLTPGQRAIAQTLLAAVGLVEWLDESQIDAVTAVSGSGPAYVFHLVECLAEAGVAAGLPPDVATRLARATVEGAAALMQADPGRTPAELRQAVTSPGGTTTAALDILMGAGGLSDPLTRAVAAAKRRSRQLAG